MRRERSLAQVQALIGAQFSVAKQPCDFSVIRTDRRRTYYYPPDSGVDAQTGTNSRSAPSGNALIANSDDLPCGPSIFTAASEQLGLKLEPRKGPVPALVIDHIEAPSLMVSVIFT